MNNNLSLNAVPLDITVPPTPYTFMTTSQVNSNVSKNKFANPYTTKYGKMSMEEYQQRVNCGLMDRELDPDKITYKYNIEGVSLYEPFGRISVADKNGNNAVDISASTLQATYFLTSNIGGNYVSRINSYFQNMFDGMSWDIPEYLWGIADAVDGGDMTTNILIQEADNILSFSTKGMSKAEKDKFAEVKKIMAAIKSDIASIYNSTNMGSEGTDIYNDVKAIQSKFLAITEAENLAHGMPKYLTNFDRYVVTGSGSDTIKFAKEMGNVAVISGDSIGIPSSMPVVSSDRDTLVFSNYALEDGSLTVSPYGGYMYGPSGDLTFGAYDWSKVKGKNPTDPTMGYVSYSGLINEYRDSSDDDIPYQAQSLTVQDKKRSYDVNYVYDSSVNVGKDGKNHIAIIDGAQVYMGKGYNFIMSTSNAGSDIHYGGGKDVYTLYGDSYDYYNVDFNKDTVLGIYDAGGTDYMNLTGSAQNMRLFFDMYYDEDASTYVMSDANSIRLLDKSNMTAKNLSSSDHYIYGMSQETVKSGILVDGDIENWNLNGYDLEMSDWIADISSQVASWLDYNGFESTSEVFENGSKAQIAELIAQYNTSNAANYLD